MIIYRQQVSILWPSAYEAITIFKFGHLRVLLIEDGVEMLCRWAIPVYNLYSAQVLTSLALWRVVSVKLLKDYIPATGFDPVTSGLWAPRATPAPCRFFRNDRHGIRTCNFGFCHDSNPRITNSAKRRFCITAWNESIQMHILRWSYNKHYSLELLSRITL